MQEEVDSLILLAKSNFIFFARRCFSEKETCVEIFSLTEKVL